ncbi:MAG: arylamine N-acetyltransferase [Chloroflexi bacterium]|nr:arylamine N-acetyltransferase [Chloroflexota bacterium]
MSDLMKQPGLILPERGAFNKYRWSHDELLAAEKLLSLWGITRGMDKYEALSLALKSFSSLPFENLSKITRHRKLDFAPVPCSPPALVRQHFESGTGGTCLSLIYLFKTMMDILDIPCRLVFADRHYGSDTHSAALVGIGDTLYLADPGYLIFHPVKLSHSEPVNWSTGFSRLVISPVDYGKQFIVSTLYNNGYNKERYRLKSPGVSQDDYLVIWKNSYNWQMMNYMIVNRLYEGEHIYIRDMHLQRTRNGKTVQKKLSPAELEDVVTGLGISGPVFKEARAALGKELRDA